MAFTQEQYTKLTDAIASGVRTVVYGDKTVTYHSLDEMIKLLKIMEQQLNMKPKTRTKSSFNKGLGVSSSLEESEIYTDRI